MVLPVIIALVIIGILATVFFIIAIVITAVTGNKQTDDISRQQALQASAGLMGISIIFVIVSMILGSLFIGSRKSCVKSTGLNVSFIIVTIILFIMLLIALITNFVIANQLAEEGNDGDAASLRTAGALVIIGLVFYGIGFVIAIIYAQRYFKGSDKFGKQLCQAENKTK